MKLILSTLTIFHIFQQNFIRFIILHIFSQILILILFINNVHNYNVKSLLNSFYYLYVESINNNFDCILLIKKII